MESCSEIEPFRKLASRAWPTALGKLHLEALGKETFGRVPSFSGSALDSPIIKEPSEEVLGRVLRSTHLEGKSGFQRFYFEQQAPLRDTTYLVWTMHYSVMNRNVAGLETSSKLETNYACC